MHYWEMVTGYASKQLGIARSYLYMKSYVVVGRKVVKIEILRRIVEGKWNCRF